MNDVFKAGELSPTAQFCVEHYDEGMAAKLHDFLAVNLRTYKEVFIKTRNFHLEAGIPEAEAGARAMAKANDEFLVTVGDILIGDHIDARLLMAALEDKFPDIVPATPEEIEKILRAA